MSVYTADLMDERGSELQVCALDLREFGGKTAAQGRIRTVSCNDDTLLVKQMIDADGHDQILVIDGAGSRHTALFGENSATTALEHGWQAVIINGLLRDVAALRKLPISIKALGSTPRRSGKVGTGAVDVPVGFGGVFFHPGAEVWSDDDGVVASWPEPR